MTQTQRKIVERIRDWHRDTLGVDSAADALTALLAATETPSVDPVEDFYGRVNDAAEADMLRGNPVTGAHHRALEREIQRYRAALPTPPLRGWQDISTAPKDGTRVLLANVAAEGDNRDAHVTSGAWQDAEEDGPDVMGQDAGFVDVDYSVYSPGRSFGNPRYRSSPVQPTHWAALPTPPRPGDDK